MSNISGDTVIDDDWVVRKLAHIRRRSRSIDSAIGDAVFPPAIKHTDSGGGAANSQEAASSAESVEEVGKLSLAA